MVIALAKLMQCILQYYASASCMVLLYDHLLTLGDEVDQVYPARTSRSPLTPLFVEDQVFLARKEMLECVNPLLNTRFC